MSLSSDLISQFVKITKDETATPKESIVYGKAIRDGETTYVQIDGSDVWTPVTTSATIKSEDKENGERVTVMIKDHTATILGNTSSPSASSKDVADQGKQISELDIVVSYKVTTDDLTAVNAAIKNLRAVTAKYESMTAVTAEIESLQAKFADLTYVSSKDMTTINADITNLKAIFGEFTDLSTEDFNAVNAAINNLQATTGNFTYLSTEQLRAFKASIEDLDANKLSAEEAELTYANIDFANINMAAVEELFSKSGIITNLVVGEQSITGELVGVTIKGDLIEGHTIVADKLVVKGEDGLYYKLNTFGVTDNTYANKYVKMEETIDVVDGVFVEDAITSTDEQVYSYIDTDGNTRYYCVVDGIYYSVITEASDVKVEQTEYNSLNGSVITAKSITATQINVKDLVAFGATIGGFNITNDAIYSEVKDSTGNITRGIHMNTDGEFNFGDSNSFVKYYKDEDGAYKLAIAVKELMYTITDDKTGEEKLHSINDIGKLTDYVKISKYEDEPCIELGESDSDFKLIITNTRILFKEGSATPAYINNQALNIDKAIIENELHIGDEKNESIPGIYVWKVRENGNLGLMWQPKEATE